MSKARLVITALLTENQTITEIATRYGVHRFWVYRLKARYEQISEAAFEPLARRPHTTPTTTPAPTVQCVLQLRKDLTDAGNDPLAPGTPPPDPHLPSDHPPHPGPQHRHRARTREATEILLHPLRSHPAQRNLAIRLHPLPPHHQYTHPRRWRLGHGDHHLAR